MTRDCGGSVKGVKEDKGSSANIRTTPTSATQRSMIAGVLVNAIRAAETTTESGYPRPNFHVGRGIDA